MGCCVRVYVNHDKVCDYAACGLPVAGPDAPADTLPFAPEAAPESPAAAKFAGILRRRDPLFYQLVRLRTRLELRRRGYGGLDMVAAVGDVDDETIDAVAGPVPVGALGDGKIIDAILAFLQSPQGQALIAALTKLLLGLLAA